MGVGRVLLLALVAAAASLTLRLDEVLAFALPAQAQHSAEAAASPPRSRAHAALAAEPAPGAAGEDDIGAAFVEAAEALADSRVIYERGEEPSADPRMTQLTRMYAAMRPKDAARIFERLDLGVQVEVALVMRERVMAGILAEMDAGKASDLMMALAGAPRARGAARPEDL